MRHQLTAALLLFCCSAAFAGDDPVPLLRYDFEDGADPTANLGSLGSTYDGDLTGNASFVPFGAGNGVELTGVGNTDWVIHGGDENALDIADFDFSLGTAFQTSNAEPGAIGIRAIMWKESSGNNPGYGAGVRRANGRISAFIADGSGFVAVESRHPVNDGVAHTMLFVRQGGLLLLYVDDCLHAQSAIPKGFGSTADNDNPIVIGGRTDPQPSKTSGPNDDFIGIVDDVEVYAESIAPPCPACIGDTVCSGTIDVSDLIEVILNWGDCPFPCPADVTCDGVVDVQDLVEVILAWGPCPG